MLHDKIVNYIIRLCAFLRLLYPIVQLHLTARDEVLRSISAPKKGIKSWHNASRMQVTIPNQCVLVETCSKYQCNSFYRSERSYSTYYLWGVERSEMGMCESLGVVYWKLLPGLHLHFSQTAILALLCLQFRFRKSFDDSHLQFQYKTK